MIVVRKKFLKLCLLVYSVYFFTLSVKNTLLPVYIANDFTGLIDFLRSYTASVIIHSAAPWQLYDPDVFYKLLSGFSAHPIDKNLPYAWYYSPAYSLLIEFLSAFSLKSSFVLWVVFQFSLLALAGYRFLWFRLCDAVIFLTPTAFIAAIDWGQNGVLIAAFYIAAFRFMKTRPLLSGCFFACAIFKPQLGLLLPLLLLPGKYYKIICSAIVAGFFIILASVYFYGIASWLAYYNSFKDGFSFHHAEGFANAMHGIMDFTHILYMPTLDNVFYTVGVPDTLSKILKVACYGYFAWRAFSITSTTKEPPEIMAQFALLALLIFPYAGIYDYVFAVSATLGLLLAVRDFETIDIGGAIIVLVLPIIFVIHIIVAKQTGIVFVPLLIWATYEYVRISSVAK